MKEIVEKKEVEELLGCEITDEQFEEALKYARHKQEYIYQRERRQVVLQHWYLVKLTEEYVRSLAFSKFTMDLCATLLPYVAQLEKINQRENNLALIKAALEHLKSNISEAENRLAEVKLKGTQEETERDIYAKAFEEHVHVLSAITALDPWVEKEKMLPVAEERNATAVL